jgi:6-phosphogluconolactonase (cycloisomerase 2 family)
MRCALVVGIVLALAGTALATGSNRGSITQLAGKAGCFVDPTESAPQQGCAFAESLSSTQNVTLSPDQRNLYATSNWTWGMDVFARNRTTGRLRELQCLVSLPHAGCSDVRGMAWAFWTVVSPDGRNVYVSGGLGNAIAVLRRNRATGRVTQPAGQDGCLRNSTGGAGPSATQSGCRLVTGMSYPRGLAIDPAGHFLYAAAFTTDAIAGFARDPQTGALTQVPGLCASAHSGCAAAHDLDGVTDVEISRDGRFVYAASFNGDGVDAFSRDTATGALTEIGCVAQTARAGCTTGRGLHGAYNLTLSRDGRSLYVVARHSAAVAVFDRDPQTGTIRQKNGTAGCLSSEATDGCGPARGLHGVRGVTVSADGRTVYTGAFSDSAIAIFARSPNGALRQLSGHAGCVAINLSGCAPGRGIRNAWGVTTSSDGRFLYTGVGGDRNSGLAVFSRAGQPSK